MASELEDRILDAAESMMARFGYRRMSLQDIAREAGLARRTIYLHFSGKEEVALCTIDRIVDRLLGRLSEIAAADGPAHEQIRRMLVMRVMHRFDSVQDYYESFDDLFAALRPAYMARRERYLTQEATVFADVISQGQVTNDIGPGDPTELAHALLLATNALLPSSLSPRELGSRHEVETQVQRIAGLLLSGLCRRHAKE